MAEGTVAFDYTDNHGELVEKTMQYGSITNPGSGEVTVFLQDKDMVYMFLAGGALSPVVDVLVMELDRNQRINWRHAIGTEGKFDVGYACLEVDDGYIIAGGRYVDEDYPQERWLAKIDKFRGLPIWEMTYPSLFAGYGGEGQADAIVAGDGDEAGDVEKISPVDGSSSSIWHCYVGYLGKGGEKIWDSIYHLKEPRDDYGHEACEVIATNAYERSGACTVRSVSYN